MTENHKRLIEDFLPIETLSEVAVREKSIRQGHISTLHLWWARRPLVAMRAAVYGTLVDATDKGSREEAARFVENLCQYPADKLVVAEARSRILAEHARRMGRAESSLICKPKVLDLFAGGGAIPLEILRLGGDAYALELNPVAHLIELCTLVFPQKYGKPNATAVGCTRDSTWAGLVDEVIHWGRWILANVRSEMGDLYPLAQFSSTGRKPATRRLLTDSATTELPPGHLLPVAYLWTRTVKCRKPSCGGTVPMVRQTWLCRKEGRSGGRYVGVRRDWDASSKRVRFKVIEADSFTKLGFDPGAGSRGGSTVCPGCHSSIDDDYVKEQGVQKKFGHQLMAVVCDPPEGNGRIYLDPDPEWEISVTQSEVLARAESLASKFGITIPDEALEANPRSFDVQHFGFPLGDKIN